MELKILTGKSGCAASEGKDHVCRGRLVPVQITGTHKDWRADGDNHSNLCFVYCEAAIKISAILRRDNGGLGTISRMFYDFLPGGFHRTVSISRHEGEDHRGRFGPADRDAPDGITPELVEWLCDGADVLTTLEHWYGADVPAMARALRVKTALADLNYECCVESGSGLEYTDLAVCPTRLDLAEARDRTPGLAHASKTLLPIPFDTARIPFKQRTTAKTFLHNAGHQGGSGRNGTAEVISAWQFVRSDARLLLRYQGELPKVPDDPRITVERGPQADDYWDLWSGADVADVYLHPTKWDALSLPMQEACCAGLPIMTTDFWPHCSERLSPNRRGWLPESSQLMAIPQRRVTRDRMCRPFDAHHVAPEAVAAAVDRVYGTDISQASADVRAVAERWSWERLGPVYVRLFEDLAAGREIPENYLQEST